MGERITYGLLAEFLILGSACNSIGSGGSEDGDFATGSS